MLSQNAIITSSTDDYLELKFIESGCHSCGVVGSRGCGIAHLSALFGHKEKVLRFTNPGGYQANDQVEILLSETIFLRSILVQYLLPLISMVLFIAAFDMLYGQLTLSLLAAMAGLYSGVQLAMYLIKHIQRQFSARDLCIRNLDRSTVSGMHPVKII